MHNGIHTKRPMPMNIAVSNLEAKGAERLVIISTAAKANAIVVAGAQNN